MELLVGLTVLLLGISNGANTPEGIYAKYFRRMEKVKRAHDASLKTLQRRSADRVGAHYAMQVVACSGVNCDKFNQEEWRGDFRGKVNQDYKLSFTKGGMCCRTESFTFQTDAFVRTDCAQCEQGGTGPSDMTDFKVQDTTKRYMYESSKVYDLAGAYTKSVVKNTIWSSEIMGGTMAR
ncbi:hypothetical protein FOL47_010035 [Perkinsus chesapeaki]|uniref:Secreted protein n=1 Tax=Perkinsus chesapeaki TaxID=330153 RepID=A0A7J6L537_PERCH|nr:hypothetical protein FOL47_010035 [Perkinsus chesapeaki]